MERGHPARKPYPCPAFNCSNYNDYSAKEGGSPGAEDGVKTGSAATRLSSTASLRMTATMTTLTNPNQDLAVLVLLFPFETRRCLVWKSV